MAAVDKSRIKTDSNGRRYIVLIYGDTLSEIAEAHFGDHTRYPELAALNKLADANKIFVGQTLYLTEATGGTTPSETTNTENAKQVTITQFGLLADGSTNELGAVWTWSRESDTAEYDIEWKAYKAGVWTYSDSTSLRRYSTYTLPNDNVTSKIQFRVRPVPKKDKQGDVEVARFAENLWTAWNECTYYIVHRPDAPSRLNIDLADLNLTAKVTNIPEDGKDKNGNVVYEASLIEFQLVKDNNLAQASIAKAGVVAGDATHTFTVEPDHKYKVRSRAYKDREYSEWSAYSNEVQTRPSDPVLSDPVAKSSNSIYIEWSKSGTATSYTIEYTDDPEGFYEGANTTPKTVEGTNYTATGLTSGLTYFFRVKAIKGTEESEWSEVKSTVIGTNPTSPTTWSSTTTAIAGEGETVALYWVHNSTDGSRQAYAEVTLVVEGVDNFDLIVDDVSVELGKIDWDPSKTVINSSSKTVTYYIVADTSDTGANRTHSLIIDTKNYNDGAKISWSVITTGSTGMASDSSANREVDIYSKPTVYLTVTDVFSSEVGVKYHKVDYLEESDTYEKTPETLDPMDGNIMSGVFTATGEQVRVLSGIYYCIVEKTSLSTFPFRVNLEVDTNRVVQHPIEYHLMIVADETYDTVDNFGNPKTVSVGESLYSKHYSAAEDEPFSVEISAQDVSLVNGQAYTLKCVVAMDSGITVEAFTELPISWSGTNYQLGAQIGINRDNCSVYIRPHCGITRQIYYKVSKVVNSYYLSDEKFDYVYGSIVDKAITSTGEQVYLGTLSTGGTTYYTIKEETTPVTDVWLSVYRREYDGTFTEIITGLDGADDSFVTDPHPSLDYARYRVIATDKKTSALSYDDIANYPIGEKAIIIQWNEPPSSFAVSEDSLGNEISSESFLRLPYNIDVANSRDPEVSLVKYIGRKHPVSYYGTQVGEKAAYSTVVPKEDTETIYALQRLQAWSGDVYVREPYGTGYWAHAKVTLSKSHLETTVPVSIDITRVEGGA